MIERDRDGDFERLENEVVLRERLDRVEGLEPLEREDERELPKKRVPAFIRRSGAANDSAITRSHTTTKRMIMRRDEGQEGRAGVHKGRGVLVPYLRGRPMEIELRTFGRWRNDARGEDDALLVDYF